MEAISDPNDDERARIAGAVTAVTSAAAISVATRLYVRTRMIRSFGWDDVIITITMAFSIVGAALAIVQVKHGAGRHRGDVPADVYQYGLLSNFISQPIYLFAICFVKLAVGSSLLRIATQRIYKRIIWSVMGFMLFYTVACFLTIMLQCTDIRVLWNSNIHATCWSIRTIQALSYTNAALNILTDLLFAIFIPLPMLWRLHVNFRTWMTLMCILGLGVFASVAGSIKVSYLPNYGKKGDFLWDSRNITIWSATELNIAILAASLPCLKPLFVTVLDSKYGRGTRGSSSNQLRVRDSWRLLSDSERKIAKKSNATTTTTDTESQVALELENAQSHAFVHAKSGTTTEIGQAHPERRGSIPEEVTALPQDAEKSILTTTTTSVQYSPR